MTYSDSILFIVHCDKDCAVTLSSYLAAEGATSQVSQRKNLEGDLAGWIVIAGMTLKMLPPILESLKNLISRGRVEKIQSEELGLEIVHPRPEDVDRVLEQLSQKERRSSKKDGRK